MFLKFSVYLSLSLGFSLIQPSYALADNCDKYSQQIEKLENLRRNGGSAMKMNLWGQKLKELEDERFRCLNDPDRHPLIQSVSGAPQNVKKRRASKTSDAIENSSAIPLATIEKPKHKLSECIKPNQLIDKEVNDCLHGLIEPTWNQNK